MLRLERLESPCDELVSDAAALEVVTDEEIARAAPREELGSALREPCVVDGADPHEAVDRLLPCRCRHVPAGQPLGELTLGEIAPRD